MPSSPTTGRFLRPAAEAQPASDAPAGRVDRASGRLAGSARRVGRARRCRRLAGRRRRPGDARAVAAVVVAGRGGFSEIHRRPRLFDRLPAAFPLRLSRRTARHRRRAARPACSTCSASGSMRLRCARTRTFGQALRNLQPFTDAYQGSWDNPVPAFRRHARAWPPVAEQVLRSSRRRERTATDLVACRIIRPTILSSRLRQIAREFPQCGVRQQPRRGRHGADRCDPARQICRSRFSRSIPAACHAKRWTCWSACASRYGRDVEAIQAGCGRRLRATFPSMA